MNKIQKKILITLIIMILVTPAGILLPAFFNTGSAWGEWSASTVKKMIGYVPKNLEKYTSVNKSPFFEYTLDKHDQSIVHQSGYYIITGIIGVVIVFVVSFIISKLILRNGK